MHKYKTRTSASKFIIKVVNHLRWRVEYTKMKIFLFFKIGIFDLLITPFLKNKLAVGIFKGMAYRNSSIGSVLLPKLYGTYEIEIQSFIKELDLNSFDVFVDIGCADGFYLAGIGRLSTIQKIIGYEVNKKAKKQCYKIISDNQLSKSRFEIKGFFKEDHFHSIVSQYKKPLILMDVDGYEKELFKNVSAHSFRNTTFLIETHEFMVPGIVEELLLYFNNTHIVQKVASDNGFGNTKFIMGFNERIKRKIVNEHRPGIQSFLKVIPKVNVSIN